MEDEILTNNEETEVVELNVESTESDEQSDQPETTEETTTETEEQLFELPDGRQVDSATLAKEWKSNFYPEFTRRSQRLKELENIKQNRELSTAEKHEWDDPEWQPSTWQEVFEAGERRAQAKIESQQKAEAEAKQNVNNWVESQLAEIRKSEPQLNEDALFSHAMKYGFQELKTAYQNMKDMNLAVKTTEKRVVDKMKARASNSSPMGDGLSMSEGITYDDFQANIQESPLEALRRLKAK